MDFLTLFQEPGNARYQNAFLPAAIINLGSKAEKGESGRRVIEFFGMRSSGLKEKAISMIGLMAPAFKDCATISH